MVTGCASLRCGRIGYEPLDVLTLGDTGQGVTSGGGGSGQMAGSSGTGGTDGTIEAGPDGNGTLACGAGACKRVFVSSAQMNPLFGSLMASDGICQSLADARNLGGTWMAWISDSTGSPSTRFTRAAVPYRLVDGTLVANDWGSLTSGTLAHPINMDEAGTTITIDSSVTEVWTGTTPSGTYAGASCQDWTTTRASGIMCSLVCAEVGVLELADFGWTAVYFQFCDRTDEHLYCFEQ